MLSDTNIAAQSIIDRKYSKSRWRVCVASHYVLAPKPRYSHFKALSTAVGAVSWCSCRSFS